MKKEMLLNKEIAFQIGRSESSVSYMKKKNKQNFEVVKIGAFCTKHNITLEDLEFILQLKAVAKRVQLKK
jgi:hypothetical protein